MTVFNQGIEKLEFLLSEGPSSRSRDQATVTVVGNVPMPSGTVLGKITATGKYVAHNTANTDGSQNAAAILGSQISGLTNGDRQALIFTRSCEVIGNRLNGGTAPIPATIAALLALGIVTR